MDLVSADGEKIGTIADLYYNRLTEVPAWMAVSAGFLSTRTLIVPVAGSSLEDGHVRTPYSKEVITEEPDVRAQQDLSPEAESTLGAYFGLGANEPGDGAEMVDPQAPGREA